MSMKELARSVITASVLMVLVTGCATVKKDWEKAKSIDDMAVYSRFRRRHPNSQFDDASANRIAAIRIEKQNRSKTIAHILTTIKVGAVKISVDREREIRPTNVARVPSEKITALRPKIEATLKQLDLWSDEHDALVLVITASVHYEVTRGINIIVHSFDPRQPTRNLSIPAYSFLPYEASHGTVNNPGALSPKLGVSLAVRNGNVRYRLRDCEAAVAKRLHKEIEEVMNE